MSRLINQKTLRIFVTAVGLVSLLWSGMPVLPAQAAPITRVTVTVDRGWSRFSWTPATRGALNFAVILNSIDPANPLLQNLPLLLTFTASAKVKCPASGNAVVNVKVYDSDQLLLSMPYTVSCSPVTATATPKVKVKGPNDYAADSHYLKVSVPVPAAKRHNLVIETDLATADRIFWGYVRADSATGSPLFADQSLGAIATTLTDAPAGAWVGVQWGDPTGTQWTNIENWLAPLSESTNGQVSHWVEAKDYGTGPYRWVVYTGDPRQGGQIWGVSDPFNFPKTKSEWIWTKVVKLATPVQ